MVGGLNGGLVVVCRALVNVGDVSGANSDNGSGGASKQDSGMVVAVVRSMLCGSVFVGGGGQMGVLC